MTPRSLPYTIRPMEPGDVPAVSAIDKLSFPLPWSASTFLYEITLEKQAFYYVLLRSETDSKAESRAKWRRWLHNLAHPPSTNSVIGYIGFRNMAGRRSEAHISTIAVHPDWRGRGLGELLLLTALEKALEMKFDVVSLEVRASNRAAQKLYQKYRFRFAGVNPGYYHDGEDAWLMTLEIKDAYRSYLNQLRHALERRILQEERPPRAANQS